MTATEELRRLLDERGVRWWEEDSHTLWYGQSINHAASAFSSFMLGENDKVHLSAMVTPEQAIAATLGPGTCRVESMHGYTDHFASTRYSVELSCHTLEDWPDCDPPEYCPWCGARVVEEVDADGQG